MVRCAVELIEIHTDGGCHGNPGPGAWAFVARVGGELVERSGGDRATTNNRMELHAVIEALRYASSVEGRGVVRVTTDSQYVRNGITSWIKSWMRNGWKTSAKKPVKNKELWVVLHELDLAISPEWGWVKGHSGDYYNERCDELVQLEIGRLE